MYKFESLSSLNYNLNSPSSATNRKYLKIETEIILCALFWLVWGGEKETWNIKSGKRNLEYKIRKKKSGIHNQEKETWNIKSGKINLVYKIRKKKPGIQNQEKETWNIKSGKINLEYKIRKSPNVLKKICPKNRKREKNRRKGIEFLRQKQIFRSIYLFNPMS